MKLLVAGSRSITDYDRVEHILSNASYIFDRQVGVVIHGGAAGVDRLAGIWADTRGYPVHVYPAFWDLYGKSAGYKRNVDMVEACHTGIVIWDGQSKGSLHTIELLQTSGKGYVIVRLENDDSGDTERAAAFTSFELVATQG